MLKQQILQKEQHRLSPQQIKLMKLVQLPVLDFEQKVRQELEDNPALIEEESYSSCEDYLEEDNNSDFLGKKDTDLDISSVNDEQETNSLEEINDYLSDDQIEDYSYKLTNDKNINQNIFITSKYSFQEYLKNQLQTTFYLSPNDLIIADFILGNIDEDGYLRRKIIAIVNDIFLILGQSVTEKKIEKLLVQYIQKLDPIGIGSRNLQECLLIQLNNKKYSNKEIILAKKIIQNYFELFIKKHYKKIQYKLGINQEKLKKILLEIKKLNPKPGINYSENSKILDYIIPDFTITIMDEKLELTLNRRNTPELIISPWYLKMLKYYNKNIKKENEKIFMFIKKKINSAKSFVDTIRQRQNTLMLTMNAIMNYQKEYFLTGDPKKIKPMILKNISQKIGVGISTVSRVANSKYVNTPYGTFLIKKFFSEKMKNKEGKNISSIKIKKLLDESISKENKERPLTDEKLSIILKNKGYIVARRTVAKYREQMKIPVSRMRKMI